MTAAAISPEQLATILEQPSPHALLDVRERAAFERGHIYRATPLPRRLLELRLPALVTAPATLIVLYDDDGSLSALAAPTLAEMGYSDVFVLTGGLAAWRRAGHPVVQGLNVPSKVFGERPDQTIVVHCGGRTRSYLGAESLRRMGLPNPIVAVKNGTMGWQLEGLELERGASRWPPAPSEKSRARAVEIATRVAVEDGTPLVSADAVAER